MTGKGALRSKDSVKMIWIVDQAKKLIYRKYTVDTWV